MARSSRSSSSGGPRRTPSTSAAASTWSTTWRTTPWPARTPTPALSTRSSSAAGTPVSSRVGSSRSPSTATTCPTSRSARPGPVARTAATSSPGTTNSRCQRLGAERTRRRRPGHRAHQRHALRGFHGGGRNGDTAKRLEGMSPANGATTGFAPAAAGSSACAGWRRTAAGCSPSATSAPWGAPQAQRPGHLQLTGRERETEDIEAAGGDRRAHGSCPRGRGVRSPGARRRAAHPPGASPTTLFTTSPPVPGDAAQRLEPQRHRLLGGHRQQHRVRRR